MIAPSADGHGPNGYEHSLAMVVPGVGCGGVVMRLSGLIVVAHATTTSGSCGPSGGGQHDGQQHQAADESRSKGLCVREGATTTPPPWHTHERHARTRTCSNTHTNTASSGAKGQARVGRDPESE